MDGNEFYHHYRAHYFCSCVLQNIQKGLIMSSQACRTILLLLRDNTFNNKASLLFFHFHSNLFSVFSLPWVFLISPLFLVSQAGYGKCELNIGFGAQSKWLHSYFQEVSIHYINLPKTSQILHAVFPRWFWLYTMLAKERATKFKVENPHLKIVFFCYPYISLSV